MLSVLLVPLALLSSLATAVPTPASAAPAKAYQIRGVQAPIYHLYLQALPSNASTPVMGPEASADTFNIASTIQSVATSKYLNIGNSTTSYKPVTWGTTATTTAWGLEGDTIITVQSSSYGRRECFMSNRHWWSISGMDS